MDMTQDFRNFHENKFWKFIFQAWKLKRNLLFEQFFKAKDFPQQSQHKLGKLFTTSNCDSLDNSESSNFEKNCKTFFEK